MAEQSGLTYGCRHCALNKLRIGLRLKDVVPAPDIQWSFGLVCDEATKVDEYINCIYDDNWHAVITRLPHDTVMGEVDDEMPERVAYLAAGFRDAYEEVQRVTGVEVLAATRPCEDALRGGEDLRTDPTRAGSDLPQHEQPDHAEEPFDAARDADPAAAGRRSACRDPDERRSGVLGRHHGRVLQAGSGDSRGRDGVLGRRHVACAFWTTSLNRGSN